MSCKKAKFPHLFRSLPVRRASRTPSPRTGTRLGKCSAANWVCSKTPPVPKTEPNPYFVLSISNASSNNRFGFCHSDNKIFCRRGRRKALRRCLFSRFVGVSDPPPPTSSSWVVLGLTLRSSSPHDNHSPEHHFTQQIKSQAYNHWLHIYYIYIAYIQYNIHTIRFRE